MGEIPGTRSHPGGALRNRAGWRSGGGFESDFAAAGHELAAFPVGCTPVRIVGLRCAALSGQNPASPRLSPRVSRWLVLGSVGYSSGRTVPVRLPGR
jgi:hypothetical protein